jgi:hypothetical protein
LQRIARGTNRVGDLVKPKNLARGRSDVPIRFEIESELGGRIYQYTIAFEFPSGFKELRVLEEKLTVDRNAVYTRALAELHLARTGPERVAQFRIDWHLVALPIVQQMSTNDPLFLFKEWLSRMLILRPIPSLIVGRSEEETLQPVPQLTNFGAWFSGLLAYQPSAYTRIDDYLKSVMPDLKDIKNPLIAKDSRNLVIQFSNDLGSVEIPFEDLSDGEKCFMICAVVLARIKLTARCFVFGTNLIIISLCLRSVILCWLFAKASNLAASSSQPLTTLRRFAVSLRRTLLYFKEGAISNPPSYAALENCR